MVVDVSKESFNVNKLIKKKNKTLMIQEDFIVPDIKPDILNIISTNGNVFISKKEIINGKLKFEGSVNLYIVYLATNGENRCINSVISFNDSIDIEEKEECIIDDNVIIKNIEIKILNERKINIIGNIELEIKIYGNEKIDIITGLKDISNIQMLERNKEIKTLLGRATTKSNSKENIDIDKIDDLAEIFKLDLKIENIENKISYNKVLAKADLEIKIMYFTEDCRVGCVKKILPIMGFLDINGITESNICDTKFKIKNIMIKPNNKEEHSIYVELDFDIFCEVYENKNINIIEDIYSTKQNIKFNNRLITIANTNLNNEEEIHEIREKISIPEATTILDATATIKSINNKRYDNNIELQGTVDINLLYETENSPLNIKNIQLPFSHKINNVIEDTEIITYMKNESFLRETDGLINVNIDIGIIKNNMGNDNLNVIENIEVEDMSDEKLYSLIIYFVKQGDTLWKISKEFKSTVDEIIKLNNIENADKLKIGEKLFIPQNI